jgi:hypothetical protein
MYALFKSGEIKGAKKIGREWRISKNALLRWLDNGGNGNNGHTHSDEDLLVNAIEKGDKKAQTALFKTANLRIRSGKGD